MQDSVPEPEREPTVHANNSAAPVVRAATWAFQKVELAAYSALGVLLAVVAVVGIVQTGWEVLGVVFGWDRSAGVFEIMDELLFVLMVVEILHTVGVSIRSGTLHSEPFLIVGLIASIRRVLVITLASSQAANAPATEDTERLFRNSMIELGVLAGLILVMVVSIMMLRRRRSEPTGQA